MMRQIWINAMYRVFFEFHPQEYRNKILRYCEARLYR